MSRSRKRFRDPAFERFKEREAQRPIDPAPKSPRIRGIHADMVVYDEQIGGYIEYPVHAKKPLPIPVYVEFPTTEQWVTNLELWLSSWLRIWVEDLYDPSLDFKKARELPLLKFIKTKVEQRMREWYTQGPQGVAGEHRMWSKFHKADGGPFERRIQLVQNELLKVLNDRTAPR